jgi:hypothetical protein
VPRITLSSLTGALPRSFKKLVTLSELRLGSNLFSGPLKGFDDFKNLIKLDLSGKHQLHLLFLLESVLLGATYKSIFTLFFNETYRK